MKDGLPGVEELKEDINLSSNLLKERVPEKGWTELPVTLDKGKWSYPAKQEVVEALNFPNPRKWNVEDEDWQLPENWEQIIFQGMHERLQRFRSFKLFMDVCVRCGACADKCHFFLGTGDPKNMPVLRAELLRSVYRGEFTLAGKLFKGLVGARKLTQEVLKEWFLYFHQCTECRRCSVYCPFGIDTAEITMLGRELLHLVGVGINWILKPASDCNRTGNHLGIEPHTMVQVIESLAEDIEDVTGITVEPTFNRKGAEILFITPSGDMFADPGVYTMMGYLLLFHHIGLDYTFSTYASEGGNFGLFTSHDMAKKLNGKMYHEAERLGVKWILGGECGHMWRVVHQYMETMNGPADFLEEPISPITGTPFRNAVSTKMVHIAEFTADLIHKQKLKLDPRRNDHIVSTFHDSCNIARGMGMLEEPRYVLRNVCNHFHEMPENTIREHTYCCGAGSGLNTDEFMETRMRGGFPRANAVQEVHERHDVNGLVAICAIDRATLPPLMNYWVPGVSVYGLHELVGNALVMEGEVERTEDLREDEMVDFEGDDD
ncbi:MAG TPA: (Fe-S)-binding protein [SAR324 cluster bacterium]|jgi:Fe-S oxidoreductase|nr:(Fe-S)-binding protein [SAR324 cluster bacterium]MDP7335560.1 (Fe-S)-binding protein [SAR324 cluster bacterium]HJM06974.1 (Fe-S)-binding protein [SAR324 cluster bacterium]HJO43906.1 (Fe-S)-binding protein [SAR324 cluster bacterium]|tara:strand:- start:4155 stop:5795 length:1641 start_codon:yes stop_codon:yes gene_type:complete